MTTTRAFGVLVLLLGPAAGLYLAGYALFAHFVALGTLLAVQITLRARPVGGFSVLLPVVYAAAAITAQSTSGVAALIVAAAAVVGAASSQGLQRGLLAVLAATLIGSSEPATPSAALAPALAMLAGSTYGYVVASTGLRDVNLDERAVHPQTALSYAVLLTVLVTVAWFAARAFGVAHGWWLPLAVAATGHPALSGSVGRSLADLAGSLVGTVALVALIEVFDAPAMRAVMLVALGTILLVAGMTRRWLRAVLFTPLLVLVASHPGGHAPALEYLQSAVLACSVVFGVAMLGQWLLWTIRPDPGHVPA
ncbi:MAG: FUSC family protein [Gammaproteobacteria bacterium]|nr:FUSC family protein [Gammaproteobacteria bacterium]